MTRQWELSYTAKRYHMNTLETQVRSQTADAERTIETLDILLADEAVAP